MRPSAGVVALILAVAGLTAGCGGGAPTRAPVPPGLALMVDGAEVVVPVERLIVYLGDEDAAHDPDGFLLLGEGVELAGAMPLDLRVGYDEDFSRMVGREVVIKRTCNPGREGEVEAHVTLPGVGRLSVDGGYLIVEEVPDPHHREGGTVLIGTIHLSFPGRAPVDGRFSLVAVTLG